MGIALAMSVACDAMAKRRITYDVSTVISGSMDIDAEGRPSAVDIDHPHRLDAAVLEYVERQALSWQFQPVMDAGHAIPIRTEMALRLVLKPVDDAFQVRIAGVVFFDPEPDPASVLEEDVMPPPRYPPEAFRAGVGGSLYVALQVGASGEVQQAWVEQVNLTVTGNDQAMKRWRDLLAAKTLETARTWKFKPVAELPGGRTFVTKRIPVSFGLGSAAPARYAQWEPYFQGPRTVAPWVQEADPPGFAPDAAYAHALDFDGDRPVQPRPRRSFLPPRARLNIAVG